MRRSLLLFLGTMLAIVLVQRALLVLGEYSHACRLVAVLWWIAGTFFTPFLVVPLHLRWQEPRDGSAVLALVTGLSSWLCAAVILWHAQLTEYYDV